MEWLFNRDCIEVMKELVAAGLKVDAVITDPPYGTSACKWDSVIPFDVMWDCLTKITNPDSAIVLFGSEPFSSRLRCSNIEQYKYDWKWKKPRAANYLNLKFQPGKNYEDIMVFSRMASSPSPRGNMKYYPQMEQGKPYTKLAGKVSPNYDCAVRRSAMDRWLCVNDGTRYPKAIQEFTQDKEKVHPTQKPIALMEYLIKTYTKEGETVLDFTMGSGTTGIACKRCGRNFIGIEKEGNWYEIAKRRISDAKAVCDVEAVVETPCVVETQTKS
jgi:site-specific DNA-methyltransferase (adenine-specific)